MYGADGSVAPAPTASKARGYLVSYVTIFSNRAGDRQAARRRLQTRTVLQIQHAPEVEGAHPLGAAIGESRHDLRPDLARCSLPLGRRPSLCK